MIRIVCRVFFGLLLAAQVYALFVCREQWYPLYERLDVTLPGVTLLVDRYFTVLLGLNAAGLVLCIASGLKEEGQKRKRRFILTMIVAVLCTLVNFFALFCMYLPQTTMTSGS